MSWIILFFAGLFEVGWAVGLIGLGLTLNYGYTEFVIPDIEMQQQLPHTEPQWLTSGQRWLPTVLQ